MATLAKVVIAVDLSDHSERAFDWYADHVYQEHHHVLAVHCVNPAAPNALLNSPGAAEDTVKEKFSAKLEARGIAGEVRQVKGKPGQAIVRVAEEEGALYVVMGTRGLGVLRRKFSASVSDYVLHNSSCPVLVFKSDDERKK